MTSFDEYYDAYGGPEGESLFHRPLLPAYNEESAEVYYNQVSEIAKHIASFHDDRILLIHGALLVESSIDDLLADIMINYRNDYFNFYTKIKLTKSFSIIPERLLDCSDLIRKTRNDFAHQIDLKDLSKVPNRVETAKQYLKGMIDQIENMGEKNVFETLLLNTAAGIEVYRPGLKLLNDTIRSSEFLLKLKNKAISLDRIK